jgi:hypothetical protein
VKHSPALLKDFLWRVLHTFAKITTQRKRKEEVLARGRQGEAYSDRKLPVLQAS